MQALKIKGVNSLTWKHMLYIKAVLSIRLLGWLFCLFVFEMRKFYWQYYLPTLFSVSSKMAGSKHPLAVFTLDTEREFITHFQSLHHSYLYKHLPPHLPQNQLVLHLKGITLLQLSVCFLVLLLQTAQNKSTTSPLPTLAVFIFLFNFNDWIKEEKKRKRSIHCFFLSFA